MPSTAIDSQIHGFLFSTDEMREIFSDRSWAQKWLDTEAALAAAQAELGIIPQEKADIIVKHADADLLDIPSIDEFNKSSITIVPLLKAFKAVLPDNAGEFVHWGGHEPGHRRHGPRSSAARRLQGDPSRHGTLP